MKPYETGICKWCNLKKEQHYRRIWCEADSESSSFLDSGTAHLCSEEVASMMLNALIEINQIARLREPASEFRTISGGALIQALKR